jgi:hypothetical protein
MIISREARLVRRVAGMEDKNMQKYLFGNAEIMRLFERHWHRWNNTKLAFKEIGQKCWIA